MKSKLDNNLVNSNLDEIHLSKFETLITTFQICPRCIGRAFGRFKSDIPNITLFNFDQLPENLKESAVSQDQCELCHGILNRIFNLVPEIIKKLESIEFSTFIVGTVFRTNDFSKSDKVLVEFGFSPLSLKHEINRELGLEINRITKCSTDFINPDLNITIEVRDKQTIRYILRPQSLYFFGRYKKLKRGIPQTKWPCSKCKGRKCDQCNFTGQQYQTSVEQIISQPFIEAFLAKSSSFHGAGREDIDALMLGTGRPFVLELKRPLKRSRNITDLIQKVNESGLVEISHVAPTEKSTIKQLKSKSQFTRKKYRALVEFEGVLPPNYPLKLSSFPITLQQRTPLRVSHRRADLIRKKKIFSVDIKKIDTSHIEVFVEAQGGAYIKEFISGDEGRTQPSLSSILGIKAKCLELDVLEVGE